MNQVFVLQRGDAAYEPVVFGSLHDALNKAYMIIEDEHGLSTWEETQHIKGVDDWDHNEWNFWFNYDGMENFVTISACEIIEYEDD